MALWVAYKTTASQVDALPSIKPNISFVYVEGKHAESETLTLSPLYPAPPRCAHHSDQRVGTIDATVNSFHTLPSVPFSSSHGVCFKRMFQSIYVNTLRQRTLRVRGNGEVW